jgi:hypothetical protein
MTLVRLALPALAPALVLVLAGCSKSDPQPEIQVPSTAPAPAPPVTGLADFSPVAFDEDELMRLIRAAGELKTLGLESRTERSDLAALGSALQANREAMAILERNGFTVERFERVLFSVGLAAGASEMKGKEGEMDEHAQALAKMKDSLSAEQYEAMKQQMEGASKMLDSMQQQPAGNVELVEKHRAEIEAAFRRK